MTKSDKPKKPKKEKLIIQLRDSLSPEQWQLIIQLTDREPRDSPNARANFLNNLFHKTSNRHGTSRDAAQDLQKLACQLYSTITGVPWGSSRDDDIEIKPRQSGQAGVDVVLSPRIRQELIRIGFPDCCECKNTKSWDLQGAITQARANTPDGSAWMIILKRRAKVKVFRIEPVVVMDLGTFTKMIKYQYRDLWEDHARNQENDSKTTQDQE